MITQSKLCEIIVEMVSLMTIKTYSEMVELQTFEERFKYLKLDGRVGRETFGSSRWLNQRLYKDPEWLAARNKAIIRDNGCDLGMPDREIPEGVMVMVHHINPITKEDILNRHPKLFDLENLITTIKITHDAIHYGDESLLYSNPVERSTNDTCPWKI